MKKKTTTRETKKRKKKKSLPLHQFFGMKKKTSFLCFGLIFDEENFMFGKLKRKKRERHEDMNMQQSVDVDEGVRE